MVVSSTAKATGMAFDELTLLSISAGSDSVQGSLNASRKRVAVHNLGNPAEVQSEQETHSVDGARVGGRVGAAGVGRVLENLEQRLERECFVLSQMARPISFDLPRDLRCRRPLPR